MTKRPVEVHIGKLVLPPGTVGAARIRAAVEREVARAVTRAGATRDVAVDVMKVTACGGAAAGAVRRTLDVELRKSRAPAPEDGGDGDL